MASEGNAQRAAERFTLVDGDRFDSLTPAPMRNESLFPHKHPVPMSAGGYDKTIHIMKPGDYGAHRSALGEAPPAFVAEDSVARSAGRFH